MPHSVRKLLLDLTLAGEETRAFCAGKDLIAFQADKPDFTLRSNYV